MIISSRVFITIPIPLFNSPIIFKNHARTQGRKVLIIIVLKILHPILQCSENQYNSVWIKGKRTGLLKIALRKQAAKKREETQPIKFGETQKISVQRFKAEE